MFKPKNQTEKSGLEKAIDKVLSEMSTIEADSEEYAQMVNQLVKLHELKQNEKLKPMSTDTLVTVGGNLLGIILIVGHERAHVVTSKALQFLKTTFH